MHEYATPNGQSWTIGSGEYAAAITQTGAALRSLTYGGEPLTLGFDADEMCHAGCGQILIPWPNRIADGSYRFDGQDQQLPLSEPARHNASHGLVRWAGFRLADQAGHRIRLVHDLAGQPGYPHQLQVSVTYAVSATKGLRVEATTTNTGRSAAPYGFGAHPYLTVGQHLDECFVQMSAGRVLEVDSERCLPRDIVDVSGSDYAIDASEPFGDRSIDNAFTSLDSPWRVRLSNADRSAVTELRSDTPWMQLYSAEPFGREGLAVEPMTCPPNAFNSGTDLVVLQPGDSHTTWFEISRG